MTENLLRNLHELQNYPEEQHWFCPRSGPKERGRYLDEDLTPQELAEETPTKKEERLNRIRDFEVRKQVALDALQVLAFDGPDAEPYKQWLDERLEAQMTSCDICVRVYHRARSELKQQLEALFDEEEVGRFLSQLDDLNIRRIVKGLDFAKAKLLELSADQRTIRNLAKSPAGLYAIFETMSCRAMLQNESLLSQHFDPPFQLIQTVKPLRSASCVPALIYFLFSKNEYRRDWAVGQWGNYKKDLITSTEFEWAVREPLSRAMYRVQLNSLEADILPHFWYGCRILVSMMDKDLITHSLRSLDIDICKLALEHLHLRFDGFDNLIATFTLLLTKSPSDYWDAMGAISSVTIIEQLFNSPSLQHYLQKPSASEEDYQCMRDLFSWVDPFLASIKPTNLTPPCRAITNQLLLRIQSERYSQYARAFCFEMGLTILKNSIGALRQGRSTANFVGSATVNDILELVKQHLRTIMSEIRRGDRQSETSVLSLDIIEQAIALDCFALACDKEFAARGNSRQDAKTQVHPLWQIITRNLMPDDDALSVKILSGCRPLVGLEKFVVKSSASLSPAMRRFNEVFDDICGHVCTVLEQMGEFPQESLRRIFDDAQSSDTVFTTLFSSDPSTRQAAIELVKTYTSETDRRAALAELTSLFFPNVLKSLTKGLQRTSRTKVFAPMSNMLKLNTDVVDVLTHPQDGLLRLRTLSVVDSKETESYWGALWFSLTVIFENTEAWSMAGHDKQGMMDFCRDTMQFADKLFDQYSIFASAITWGDNPGQPAKDAAEVKTQLLNEPQKAFAVIVKWLRLRDEYLISVSVSLVKKLLLRLKEVNILAPEQSLTFIHELAHGKIRAKLSPQQNAELESALEKHTGKPSVKEERIVKKQGKLNEFFKDGQKGAVSSDDSDAQLSKLIKDSSSGAEAYKARLAVRQAQPAPAKKADNRDAAAIAEFKKKREEGLELARKRKEAAIAKAKGGLLKDAGSGVNGIGVIGKDHAVRGQGVMVSSDEESESDDDDMDAELFGKLPKPAKKAAEKKMPALPKGPVKKVRQIRSAKDMRARLAPDLTNLHRDILGWDYFHDGDYPPNSRPDIYKAVPKTFNSPHEYENTFKPLLTLEAWQGFVKAREEGTFKTFEVKVNNRSSVDSFMEVAFSMSDAENKDIFISEGDIILLSKSGTPHTSPDVPHCLARVGRVIRKKGHLEILYRIVPGSPMVSSLAPGSTVYGAKIQSITPLEREYGALSALKFYDLCDEICKARPSEILKYTEKQLQSFVDIYNLNPAQAKAVKSAMDNDAFTLIQGPPGSGKTKTIVALVGAILTDSLREQVGTAIQRPGMRGVQDRGTAPVSKKLLVCAPSNAAVDELVMRFKEGIKTTSGQHKKINVVRLGRSDAINTNVRDVTLDELVSAKLNGDSDGNSKGNLREETQKMMKEHQAVSAKIHEVREQLNAAKGEEASKLKDEFDALKRRQRVLGAQIDDSKDKETTAVRQADINRKRAQQMILDSSHVICATLSGSGHEMFQGLSIEFETVVVDEAAQCVEMSALIPLKYGCVKAILVGDPKQLPPTVFSKEAARFQYEQSLFVRMQGNHPNDVHLLDTQYRMHPDISMFPSRTFYDGRLLDGGDMATLRNQPWHVSSLLGPYRFFDVQGQHQAAPKGHSLINIAEIDVALQLYERLKTDFGGKYDLTNKIGIITPYKSQLRELKERFSRKYGQDILAHIEFNTTDAFQGRESEIIIFSCVRASPAGGIGFLQDIRRMNVGLTRAKSSLWVLGNSQSLIRGEFWRKLVEDAQSRGLLTTGNIMQMLKQKSSTAPANVGLPPAEIAPMIPSGPAADRRNSNIPTGPAADRGGIPTGPQGDRRGSGASFTSKIKREDESRRSSVSSTSTLDVKPKFEQSRSSTPKLPPIKSDPDGMDIDKPRKKRKASDSEDDEDVDMQDAGPVPAPRAGTDQKPSNVPPAQGPPRPRMVPPKKKREIDPFLPKAKPRRPQPGKSTLPKPGAAS